MTAGRTNQGRGQLWLLASEGQARRGPVAEVALRVRSSKLYRYAVPDSLAGAVRPGVLVRVPYGPRGRSCEGWCVRVTNRTWNHTYKPIEAVVLAESPLSEALLELGMWVSEYYACPPGQTFDAIVPALLRERAVRKVRYLRATGGPVDKPLSKNQQILLDTIGTGVVRCDEALRAAGVGRSSLHTLRKRGLIEVTLRDEPGVAPARSDNASGQTDSLDTPEDAFVLTPGQRSALDSVRVATDDPGDFKVFLLFGVPGSGKTEVYVRAIRRVIEAGRQAILLVPEIALATQVVERLARRFERVAVLHSRLNAGTRGRTLRAIAAGEIDVVIGTRTAVFAPCPRLGLIAADEEQESSFKSLQAPFFNARDVAIKRGQIQKIPVVLGSATPALETWYNAGHLPHFQLLRLPERVPGARVPTVRLVEMGRRQLGDTGDVLSPELVRHLRDTLAAGHQAIVLHNRRGYAIYLRCTQCGLMVSCDRCGSHMVFHRADDRVKCHRCGAWGPVPEQCLDNSCRGRLRRAGSGIQRLEQELAKLFPAAQLQRLDSDSMRRREDYAAALERFAAGETQILLGTQMVAKGLDFPGVRLVGVLEGDAALWLPDFRAAESAFQLLVQVVGRAGRRAGNSLALVQAENVTLPAISKAVEMDYEAFAEAELTIRRRIFDPPFSRLIRFICADSRARRVREEAALLAERLRLTGGKVHAGIRIDPPEACVIPRLREMFRYHVLVRVPRDVDPRSLLRVAEQEKALAPRVKRFSVDVDPLDML